MRESHYGVQQNRLFSLLETLNADLGLLISIPGPGSAGTQDFATC